MNFYEDLFYFDKETTKVTKNLILEMGEAEKISSLLAISAFLMWPILFSGSSLFFSERQKDQLSELGKVKASLWRLGKILGKIFLGKNGS